MNPFGLVQSYNPIKMVRWERDEDYNPCSSGSDGNSKSHLKDLSWTSRGGCYYAFQFGSKNWPE